jgi:enterochelin esterase-like enzyme
MHRATLTRRVRLLALLVLPLAAAYACVPPTAGRTSLRFEISFPASLDSQPVDGRVFLMIARNDDREPRFQVADWTGGQPFFGVDVDGLQPGQAAVVDGTTLGYPITSIADIPAGDYYVQGLLNVYTTFHRADGHTIKMHMDQWEGQRWNVSPGNFLSDVQRVHVDPARGGTIRITLTKTIPPIDPPADTKYVKHVKIKSELVSKFWGHDMDIGAVVVLPPGFDQHPNAHYPVAYEQNHFRRTFTSWRETPPDPKATGRDSTVERYRYQLYRDWAGGGLPKMLIVIPQHPNPYYDDAYAVNSANIGPYGDAITQELIPYVEQKFRAIGKPWARSLFGGSTGGWESLASQIFYPDFYNGTWTFCPDPVDFHYFQLTDIYNDSNAYFPNNSWRHDFIRPGMRGLDNQVLATYHDMSWLEAVLGTHGRSGEQLDVFQAVFGPEGPDGYTHLLYDKTTGTIDKGVVDYWRDHYDLTRILRRDWPTLGPKLKGKIHLYVGENDTFYLEEAAYLLHAFLDSTRTPPWGGTWDLGDQWPHCYAGANRPGEPRLISSLTMYQRILPLIARHMVQTAPKGADMSWRY